MVSEENWILSAFKQVSVPSSILHIVLKAASHQGHSLHAKMKAASWYYNSV